MCTKNGALSTQSFRTLFKGAIAKGKSKLIKKENYIKSLYNMTDNYIHYIYNFVILTSLLVIQTDSSTVSAQLP